MDLRKSVLALLALGFTGVVSAGGFMEAPACTNQPVTVPCEHSGWDIGVTAYWGRVSSGYMDVDQVDTGGLAREIIVAKPSDHFGFGLEGSFHWGAGHDFTVDWTHFNKTSEQDYNFTANGVYARTGYDGFVTNQFKFDAINFELGQQINVGANWDLRVHVGAQYMKLDRDLSYAYASSANMALGDYLDNQTESRFNGFGPRAGFDAAYHVATNWSIVGDTAVTVLAGRSRGTVDYLTFINNAVVPADTISYDLGKRRPFVAGLDGKLGLRFDQKTSSGDWAITGGYAGSVYVNPIVATYFGGAGIVDESHFGIGSFFVTLKYTS